MSVPQAPQGPVPAIGIPDSQDYPRLVFSAPYFTQVPLAELIAPAVTEAVEAQLPSLVPPFVDQAAQDAVNQLAVLLAGSTMQGPLFLNPVMPVQDSQAASKAYVDSMLATAGIPEVPPTPIGQVWARETGQWVPISQSGGTYLPLGGGTMQGQINMGGNAITNLPALPVMPNGAAPASWVLQQIASTSLYQGTWNMDTYTPDLTQLSTHVNAWTWIAITTSPSGVVIGPPIPGLQGQTVFNGDTVIYSATAGAFQAIHSGGLTLAEANALYLSLNGGQLSGPLLLNANATQPTQAVTLQQLQGLVAGYVSPDAPTDGQGYLRVGATQGWTPGLPLTGGVTTGPILLSGNASNALAAVPYQQLVSYTAGNFLPLAGGSMTGLIVLSGNATAPLNPVTLTQLTSMLGSYLPLAGGTLTGNLAISGTNTLNVGGSITAGTLVTAPALQFTGGGQTWQWLVRTGEATLTLANATVAAVDSSGGVNAGVFRAASGNVMMSWDGTLTSTNNWQWAAQPASGELVLYNAATNNQTVIFHGDYSVQFGNINFDAAGGVNCGVVRALSGNVQVSWGTGTQNYQIVASGGENFYVFNAAQGNNAFGVEGTGNNFRVGQIQPWVDNGYWCGIGGGAWIGVAAYDFAQQSDPENKRDIAPCPDGALQMVEALEVINYRHVNDAADAPLRTGFDASEVQKVHNDAAPDGKQYSMSDMNALLWKAVQELSAKVAALEAAKAA